MSTHHPSRRLLPAALLFAATLLAGCGFVMPGTPGHEPPNDSSSYNPVSHEDNQFKF